MREERKAQGSEEGKATGHLVLLAGKGKERGVGASGGGWLAAL